MKVTYNKQLTALLVIDPYNDFISEGGKLWDRLKGVAEANHCVPNMLQVLNAARKTELRVFYALHHRYRPGDYETWKYIAPIQKAAWERKAFEYGTWGGEIRREFEPQPGEIVAQEHWGSSGFANTDLDLQLKRHGIHQLIVIGLIAHTCVEATVRYAAELGYEVTVVKDATASYSDEHMHASLDINIPNYASAIVPRLRSSTRSLLSRPKLQTERNSLTPQKHADRGKHRTEVTEWGTTNNRFSTYSMRTKPGEVWFPDLVSRKDAPDPCRLTKPSRDFDLSLVPSPVPTRKNHKTPNGRCWFGRSPR